MWTWFNKHTTNYLVEGSQLANISLTVTIHEDKVPAARKVAELPKPEPLRVGDIHRPGTVQRRATILQIGTVYTTYYLYRDKAAISKDKAVVFFS